MSNPIGRPTIYSEDLATEICLKIASGQSLRSICKSDKFPNITTVLAWVIDGKHEDFSKQYARAREAQAEVLADEIFDIADDGQNDYMERQFSDGSSQTVLNAEAIGRSRLRVDSRKWYLSKVLPKKYGEKVEHTHQGGDKPILISPTAAKW